MNKVKITLNQELINMIQALHYDISMRKEIITFILTEKAEHINKVIFDEYHKELTELNAKYLILKEEINNKYIPMSLKNHNITWEIDFINNYLIVTKNCDCEVDYDATT